MPKLKFICFWLVLVLLAATTAASADFTVFTDETAFLNQLQTPYYLEDFEAYVPEGVIGLFPSYPPLNLGPVNGFSYNISSTVGVYKLDFDPSPSPADTKMAISTLWGDGILMVTDLSGPPDLSGPTPITAVGGEFFPTNEDPPYSTTGTVYVSINDGDHIEIIEVTSTDTRPFRGFISDTPITSISIYTYGEVKAGPYPTMDHFYVGTQVPIPASALLLGSGLLGLGLLGWRRKQS